MAADDLNGLWRFSDVEPTFKKYVKDRGIKYDPDSPLRGLSDSGAGGEDGEDKAAGEMVKRAFTAIDKTYSQQKNVVADFHVSQSRVSDWYRGNFKQDALFNTIFPALCDAYVKAFCGPEVSEYEDSFDHSRSYYLERTAAEPVANSLSGYKGPGWRSEVEIELRALSILLKGAEDPHIYKNPVHWITGGMRHSKEAYYRAAIRLASSMLGGWELERLGKIAEDYMHLRVCEIEEFDRGHVYAGRDYQIIRKYGIDELLKPYGIYTSDAAEYDELAAMFEKAALELTEYEDLPRLRDGASAEIESRYQRDRREYEEWKRKRKEDKGEEN